MNNMSDDTNWLQRHLKATTQPEMDTSTEMDTTIKILLHTIGEPLTDKNIQVAIEYVRNCGFEMMDRISNRDKRKLHKGLRKELHRSRTSVTTEERHYLDDLSKGAQFDRALKPMERTGELDPDEFGDTYKEDVAAIAERFKDGFVMEKPQGTSFHHFLDFVKEDGGPSVLTDFFKREFQSFVVEHDWAKAFEGVRDFDGGEIRLPFEYTCFEFRLSGIRVLVFLGESTGCIEGVLTTGINKRWYIQSQKVQFRDGKLYHPHTPEAHGYAHAFLEGLARQIRAICIMLDAKVAVGERRSVGGAGLNKRRIAAGKLPLRDYHVVTLAKRLRPEHHEGEETGIRHRLHWRRGHWRHFESPGGQVRYINNEGITVSKTWINWQLVGDETLGFVDKHYKL